MCIPLRLFFMNRLEMFNRVKQRGQFWDFVIIGGGATSVVCAVDAASRGFDTLLLEQNDFGKGISSRLSKLVHGGVHHLAQGNLSLVREALKERGILKRNAPHRVKIQSFIVPCYSLWQKFFYCRTNTVSANLEFSRKVKQLQSFRTSNAAVCATGFRISTDNLTTRAC